MKKPFESLRLILRDLRFVGGISPQYILYSVVEGATEGFAPFVGIYTSALLINGIAAGLPLQTLITYALVAAMITMAATAGKAAARHAKNFSWTKMRHKLDLMIATKMSQIDYASLESPETHQLYRSLGEIENLVCGFMKIGNVFVPTVKGVSAMILSVAMTLQVFTATAYSGNSGFLRFICSPACSLVILACILSSVVVSIWSSKGVLKAHQFYLGKSHAFNNRLLYYTDKYVFGYAAAKDIRIYGQKGIIHSEIDILTREKYKVNDQVENQTLGYLSASLLVSGLLNLAAYVYVGLKALAGLFAVGNIVRYVGGLLQFTGGLAAFLDGYTQLKANTKFMDSYYRFFGLPNALHTGSAPVPSGQDWEVEFKNVSFRYPGSEVYALKDLSCRLTPGKRYAIVGMNGSGKTTLIKLLCRLYDPQEGVILLNGRDIREYDYDEYLGLFSVVFQDFKLFPFALGQNVAAAEDFDREKAENALHRAGFGERLEQMEAGCDTIIYKDFDEDGVEISGGEAQKVAIARALYKDAPFVVLDEPTAALDPLAEQEIYQKFDGISQGKTTVYISHRLSSCKFCDEILVIDRGRLAQQGAHLPLLERENGKYHELWHAQARHYV